MVVSFYVDEMGYMWKGPVKTRRKKFCRFEGVVNGKEVWQAISDDLPHGSMKINKKHAERIIKLYREDEGK